VQVRTVDGFVERSENEWPLARTRWTHLYLDPHAEALSWERPEAAGSVAYEPLDGPGVTFWSPPFTQDTEITGPLAARLHVESASTNTDLFLVLRAFDGSGEELLFAGAQGPGMPLAQGWLRASHRKLDPQLTREYRPYHPHDEDEPLEPGTVYPLDVEIWPTSLVVPVGYRLALTVRGTDFFAGDHPGRPESFGPGHIMHDDPEDRPRSTFGGTVRLHAGGERDAYVLLPVIPR
jgi:predicted acyl esterase